MNKGGGLLKEALGIDLRWMESIPPRLKFVNTKRVVLAKRFIEFDLFGK